MTSVAEACKYPFVNAAGEYKPPKTKKHKENDPLINLLGKASAIGLAVFAAYTLPNYFKPAFAVGMAWGLYDNTKSTHKPHSLAGCVQEFLADKLGVKLPLIVALIGGTAADICHIDHHSEVYVPMAGFIFGMWVSQQFTVPAASWCYRKLQVFRST